MPKSGRFIPRLGQLGLVGIGPKPGGGWAAHPNLRLGMGGAKGRGRLQRLIARAFIGHDVLTTSQVFDWCFARDRQVSWRRRHRWSVVRVLDQVADRIGRADTIGQPWLWRLKTPAAETASAPSD